MNDEFLNIELRIIVARYGRAKVQHALASLQDASVPEIASQISELEVGSKRKPKRERLVADTIAEATEDRPGIKAVLDRFAELFGEKIFLPELRDVQSFLERNGFHRANGSRRDAIHLVIHALASFQDIRLRELLETTEISGESGYEALANEIISPTRKRTPAGARHD